MWVTELTTDEHAIRIRYTVTPALPMIDPAGRPTAAWWWEATDDCDTRYRDVGGAYGPSRDGQRTEGVFSLDPLPPPEARTLRVVLHLNIRAEAHERECAFTVDLTGEAG
jgi:hypothetical protein